MVGLRLCWALALAFTFLLAAAPGVRAEKRLALVIGNSGYQHVSRLPNPANDAADIAEALTRLGFAVRRESDMSFDPMRRALREFSRDAAGAEMAAVFFAGHGMEIDRQNYLIPVDARLATDRDIAYEAVPLELVLGAVEGASRLRLVVLDACRNNPFAAAMKFTSPTRSIGRGLAPVEPRSSILIGFAAREGTIADDGSGRNSPYTAALLAHIEQEGVEINKLFRLVRDKVMAATGGRQQPFVYGSTSSEDLFLKVPLAGAQPPPTAAPEAVAADYGYAAQIDTVAGWDAFLETHASKADNLYVKLAREARDKRASAPRVAVGIPEPVPLAPDSDCDGVRAKVADEERCLMPKDTFRDCPDCPEMVVIPAGRFIMGSPASENQRSNDEGPQHEVTIPKPFAVGKFEVTFAEWEVCVSAGGCGDHAPTDEGWGRETRPVINVSWNDAQAYVAWLSGETGQSYRLLSESEWEYAARAGSTTPFSTGARITTEEANFDGIRNDQQSTLPVGSFAANEFGLHDMHGNAWEWVEDCRHDSYQGAPSDGSAWTAEGCKSRVLRGGSWVSSQGGVRAANRGGDPPGQRGNGIGFRVARTLAP